MPPFDYHPASSDTTPAPKVKQATPSALQKLYLRSVDTGPDSIKGARFRNTPVSDQPFPNNASRAIFTEKLLQHERDVLMPYLRSDKVPGSVTEEALRSGGASADTDIAASGASEGTNAQMEADGLTPYDNNDDGAPPTPPATTSSNASSNNTSASASNNSGNNSNSGSDGGVDRGDYAKTFVPGMYFDKNLLTTVWNARLGWILGAVAAFGVFLLMGMGAWGAALMVDLFLLFMVCIYLVFQAFERNTSPAAGMALVLTAIRDKYRSNPTLWQSALLAVLVVYLVSFALDLSGLVSVAVAGAAAWTVVASQIVFLAAKHWARVDLFDLLPDKWYHGDFSPTTEEEEEGGDAAPPAEEAAAKEEVFHVNENVYTYGEAADVCASLDAKLANYDQVEDAYIRGAEWCSVGWSEGQMAFFPTQKQTWDQLQQSTDPDKRHACGRPGVNGGYMPDPTLKFGVNCYGVKPAQSDHDVAATSLRLHLGIDGGGSPKYERDQLRLHSFNRSAWSQHGGGANADATTAAPDAAAA